MILRKAVMAVAVFAFLAILAPAPSQAAGNFGAIAIEVGTWAWGFQTDSSSDADAVAGAMSECNKQTNGRNDCTLANRFSGAFLCGTVANDPNSQRWAWGRGASSAESIGAVLGTRPGWVVITTQCNSASSTPAPAAFVPEPIRVTGTIDGNDTSPIVVFGGTIESRPDRTFRQCISFRNIANKDAAAVRFRFQLLDSFNGPVESFTGTNEGRFSPGIAIENKCWSDALWPAARIRSMRVDRVSVVNVKFSDDTVWTPGIAWTKTFSTSGAPLPAPQVIAAFTPGTQPNGGPFVPGVPAPTPTPNGFTPVNIGDASGGGGSLGATTAYGAIAMQPGTHAVGVSTDASNPDAAVYDAMAKCNAKSAGTNNCEVIVKFSGKDRCAAVAVDGNLFGFGVGPDPQNTIATAYANLRAKGGNIGNNIAASPCNSR